VGITLFIVLLLETLALTAVFLIITRSPFLGYLALERAGNAARLYALQAALYSDGGALKREVTFEPGHAASLSLRQENDPPQMTWWDLEVPYIQPGAPAEGQPACALLIDMDGKILASSYPERYPAGTDAARALPDDAGLIRGALEGTPDGDVRDTPQGRLAALARPVRSRDQALLGAVYIQAPAGVPPGANLLSEIGSIVLPSSLFWLCLMLPIGLLFGVLTTRGIIRRIERLAGAAARFSDADFKLRVPVSRADEIGLLEQQFNRMAEQVVDSFAQRQAFAEQSARREERARIEQEMTTARYIQQSLLPEEVPSVQELRIEPFYQPAAEVGGDLYDLLPLPDGRVGIVIGDVTGKGMPAALIMATTTAMIRAAATGASTPGNVLARVNNLLQAHISPGMFATCFFAIHDPRSGQLCFANAGHNIPYLARAGEIVELRATGMPLGLMADQAYPELDVVLQEQDVILFYTDGLVEARNAAGEIFSFPRLQQLLKDHAQRNDLIGLLLGRLQEFTGAEWTQDDDITLLVVQKRRDRAATGPRARSGG
jgi:serine phosphatase RsbU (regulator of sigma subunit)